MPCVYFVLGFLCVLLSSCSPATAARHDAAAHGEIATAWTAFETACMRRDARTAAAMFAPDAIAMRPNAPSDEGRDAVQRALTDLLCSASLQHVGFSTRELTIQGDRAFELGTFTARHEDASGVREQRGRYSSTWKRQAGGRWQILRLLFNHSVPP